MTAVSVFTSTSIVLLKSLWSTSKLYFFWILVHYVSTHTYTYFCTPDNIVGFIKSPFMIITPQCYALDWIQQKSREIIKNGSCLQWGSILFYQN